MTLKEAIELYKKAKNVHSSANWMYEEDNIKHLSPPVVDAIFAIRDAGCMTEVMGGELSSRQVIAAIIVCAELKHE